MPVSVLAVELEATRAKDLVSRVKARTLCKWDRGLAGDAFALTWKPGTACSALFLNPPYDSDPEHGRLEQRFLARFTDALAPGGALIYIIPAAALETSAEHLAEHFRGIRCWRFPEADFAEFRQVVVTATRDPAFIPGPGTASMAARIIAWGRKPEELPELPESFDDPLRVPVPTWDALEAHLAPFDRQAAIEGFRPLEGAHGPGFSSGIDQLMEQSFPAALPPRAAHVALALAAGHFNGQPIAPDHGIALPPLLIKGACRKERVEVLSESGEDGAPTKVVQVERPTLRLTALRLDTLEFLEPAVTGQAEPNGGAPDPAKLTAIDILNHYGESFAGLMQRQFPALHDPGEPGHRIRLPDLPRKPFAVQHEAISGALKLLARGENPKFLSQVGTGKTTVSLIVFAALTPRFWHETAAELARVGIDPRRLPRARRLLVIHPPHIRGEWEDEALAVMPWARVQVVKTIADLRQEADIYLLSRETAKLGHGWRGVAPDTGIEQKAPYAAWGRPKFGRPHKLRAESCPKCGDRLPPAEIRTAKETAEKRCRCSGGMRTVPANQAARLARRLADILLSSRPNMSSAQAVCTGERWQLPLPEEWLVEKDGDPVKSQPRPRNMPLDTTALRAVLFGSAAGPGLLEEALANLDHLTGRTNYDVARLEAAVELARALGESAAVRERILEATKDAVAGAGSRWNLYSHARQLAAGMAHDEPQRSMDYRMEKLEEALDYLMDVAEWKPRDSRKLRRYLHRKKARLLRWAAASGEETENPEEAAKPLTWADLEKEEQVRLARCGEPLFQAIPEPRRYPLSRYICERMPDRFDLLVIDEAHEANNLGTAQQRSAHRLTELGIPTLLLTGSMMSGYASSLFANWWATDRRRFRQEFEHGEVTRFVERFGLRKLIWSPAKSRKGRDARRGATTDLTDSWVMRVAGEAPGVLPLFILRHALPTALLMHKADLDQELPPLTESRLPLGEDPEGSRWSKQDHLMLMELERLTLAMIEQVKADMFDPILSGKLWGAMMELPSYPDRCTEDLGIFELRYPESVGGHLVERGLAFPAGYQTPKERALLAFIRQELAQGRRVLVFLRHVNSGLPKRLERLIVESGAAERVAYLDAKKVDTDIRREWIRSRVVATGCEVLLVNPNAVRTGLNTLTYFASAWWHEPDYSAQTYRQANGRLHRVGQVLPVEIVMPFYAATAQEVAVDLVARKVTASLQVDALGVRGALELAGAGEESVEDLADVAMTLGQALYERLRAR